MHRKKVVLTSVFLSLAVILLMLFLLNKTAVIDWFKGIGYNPTPAMLDIKSSLGLTGDGERIWNATKPILASSENFNESCESHDEAVSVLGCYTGDQIYVYNIETNELPGIRESTSAHEFLHAVWHRLTGLEKSKLIPVLESTYKNHSELKETIESYPSEEHLDEIYVRLATQIKDLPTELETHYAKYFSNQDLVVSFYESYIAPFNALKEENEALKQELEALEKEINEKTTALDERIASFDTQVKEFNSCADTSGCFSSNWEFATRRAELVTEQQAINADNNALNALIDSYNKKAEKYNSNVARSSDLQKLLNSNSVENVIEE